MVMSNGGATRKKWKPWHGALIQGTTTIICFKVSYRTFDNSIKFKYCPPGDLVFVSGIGHPSYVRANRIIEGKLNYNIIILILLNNIIYLKTLLNTLLNNVSK